MIGRARRHPWLEPVGHGLLLACLLAGSAGCAREGDERSGAARPRERMSETAVADGPAPGGYVLFSPLLSTTTYLVDRRGRVVHTWESELAPGVSVYLLANGHLLRPGRQPGVAFRGGGQGGRLQEIAWDGELVWDWAVASEHSVQHHDIEPLPNGNVLAIVWESKSRAEAIAAGRRPDLVGPGGLWPDGLLEIEPRPPDGGRIVWEWHLWDHLIQEHDPRRANYGRVSDHPERVDINGGRGPAEVSEALLRRLQALGYLARGGTPADTAADFVHTNSVAYNPQLDQIALSVSQYNEIWILDHSTTSREAAGHRGGRAGKGGDLLYRWGNPRAYGRGSEADQQLFGQHDARWIPPGCPGAGNLLVFNNGSGRPGGRHSSVVEIELPLAAAGGYRLGAGRPFGPRRPVWEYTARPKRDFFADFISGAQRRCDGNTLISSGPDGRLFEVTPVGETVWEYRNRYSGDAPNPAGDPRYSLFWASYVAPDHPALAGRRLEPLAPQPPPGR